MFAFLRPYHTIRQLEQEVSDLQEQLDAERVSHSCRALSLMTPTESLSMLQAKGADMLASISQGMETHAGQLAAERATLVDMFTRLHHAEHTAQVLKEQCDHHDTPTSNAITPKPALHDIRQLSVTLARSAAHTRALAMSAALEIAHTDAPSSGMAAVVQDMERLAEYTQRLSRQLDQCAEQIAEQIKQDAQAVAHQCQVTQTLTQAAQEAEKVIEQLTDQARHMYKVIHHSTTTACLHAAKLEHAAWKSRLYKQLLSAQLDETLEDHQHCTLGQWYYLGDGKRFQQTAAYRALAGPHRRFHESGLEALRFARQGDHTGQLASLALMEEASLQLVQQLDQLIEYAVYEVPLATGHRSPLADAP
ncbi:CZB domain-containing protein [Halomonas sp. 7T]|uniref:CZB domain-containing protein n=1 Tax=Halomonas sp. 7T TaxID=2893469 RepID=UPI0021D9F30C|nr:CZB domain-containing protein [Halomonas sp. 7T]UXZ53349.1 CZB domain-containing protein [Halomonas sp. 7T]